MPENADFVAALTEEFCKVLDPLVDDEIDPQDCYDPLQRILGQPLTPDKLAGLSTRRQKELCAAFVEWFECDTIHLEDIQEALDAVARRWPGQQAAG